MPGYDDVPYGTIADALQGGLLVAFLGSAASAVYRPTLNEEWSPGKSFLPFGFELAKDLAKAGSFPINGEKPDLPLVASYYANVSGDPTLLKLRLRRAFNVNCQPGMLHRLLATTEQPLLIVTTNYDDMMERAFTLKSRSYHLVVDRGKKGVVWVRRSDGKAGDVNANKLTQELKEFDCPIVYKLHGCLDRDNSDNDHFLITEQDYVDFLGRSTLLVPQYLWNRMEEKNFLFLGYSLVDWNVRVLLRKLRNPSTLGAEDRRSWAIIRHPGAADEAIWRKHGIEMFDCDLQQFTERLAQTMGLNLDKVGTSDG